MNHLDLAASTAAAADHATASLLDRVFPADQCSDLHGEAWSQCRPPWQRPLTDTIDQEADR